MEGLLHDDDSEEDYYGENVCLAERLRRLKAEENCSLPPLSSKILRQDPCSSTMQNGSVESGHILDVPEYHMKKRQNSDMHLDRHANHKRTCLQDFEMADPISGAGAVCANGHESPSLLESRPQSVFLHPDRTYEDHMNPHSNRVENETTHNHTRPIPSSIQNGSVTQNSAPHGVHLIDSASDDDFQPLPKSGALKGGRQLPDQTALRKSARNRARRILDSDSDDDDVDDVRRVRYRRHKFIFSSSDSDDIQSSSYGAHSLKKEANILPTIDCDSSSRDLALPCSSSSGDPQMPHRFRHKPCVFNGRPPSPPIIRPLPKMCYRTSETTRTAPKSRKKPILPDSSSRVIHPRPLPRGLKPYRRYAKMTTASGNNEGDESSEIEFFSANSYSDTETNAESMDGLISEPGGRPINLLPTDRAADVAITVSSEDEITFLCSHDPRPRVSATRRRGAPRALGRRCGRGTRRRSLPNCPDVISLSPDPVEQVRQVEEDEMFARMLQAQFDSEVDPDFNPCQFLTPACHHSPTSSSTPSSSNDSNVDTNDLHPFFIQMMNSLPQPERQLSTLPIPVRNSQPGRNGYRGRARGRRRNLVNFISGLQGFQGISPLHLAFGSHLPLTTRLLLEDSTSDDNSYESLLTLAEENGGDVPRGLNRAEIERLPTRKFLFPGSETPAHPRADLNKECQVCLSDYANGDLLRILPCFHEFHTRCIDKWLKINHSCPVCREVVHLDT